MSEKELSEIIDDDPKEESMSFLEHLEEFRWRIIYSLIGIVLGTIIAWIFIDYLVDYVLLVPAKSSGSELQNLKPFGQLFMYMQIAIIVGCILSIPNIFYQFWKFISPALRKKERKYISLIVIFSSLCFLLGIAFAYLVMLPLALKFASKFGSTSIKNFFAIDEYMSIILSVMLTAGFVFELPMVSLFLTKLGILTPSFMKKYRKHAIVIILVASAILTPGTDPVSQVILAVPLLLLYEISILISKIARKKK